MAPADDVVIFGHVVANKELPIQLSVVHGPVSRPGKGYVAGELQLWYTEGANVYTITVSRTAGRLMSVCELLMFYSFTSKSALTKSKLY